MLRVKRLKVKKTSNIIGRGLTGLIGFVKPFKDRCKTSRDAVGPDRSVSGPMWRSFRCENKRAYFLPEEPSHEV